jgi:hypothetical protein
LTVICTLGTTQSSSKSAVSVSISVTNTLFRDSRRSLMMSVATKKNWSLMPMLTNLSKKKKKKKIEICKITFQMDG